MYSRFSEQTFRASELISSLYPAPTDQKLTNFENSKDVLIASTGMVFWNVENMDKVIAFPQKYDLFCDHGVLIRDKIDVMREEVMSRDPILWDATAVKEMLYQQVSVYKDTARFLYGLLQSITEAPLKNAFKDQANFTFCCAETTEIMWKKTPTGHLLLPPPDFRL